MKKWHIVLSVICLIMLVFYVDNNLKTNSVYYAKHMPHRADTLPEAIILIDYMEEVYTPEIEGIEYDIDGTRFVLASKVKQAFGNGYYSNESDYIYTNKGNIMYTFNKRMNILSMTDRTSWQQVPIEDVDKQAIIQEIKEFLSPIVESQPEPKVNLQWIFNLIYQGQFE